MNLRNSCEVADSLCDLVNIVKILSIYVSRTIRSQILCSSLRPHTAGGASKGCGASTLLELEVQHQDAPPALDRESLYDVPIRTAKG